MKEREEKMRDNSKKKMETLEELHRAREEIKGLLSEMKDFVDDMENWGLPALEDKVIYRYHPGNQKEVIDYYLLEINHLQERLGLLKKEWNFTTLKKELRQLKKIKFNKIT